jgi:VIT1/CCC1 family predicted Fe2+/Mn2+ transporter
LVDAVMYLLAVLAERGRNLTILNDVRRRSNPADARDLILDALPPVIASTLTPADVDAIQSRLRRLPLPAKAGLTAADFRTALGVFLLVFLAALPFAFIAHTHLALRVSNGIALLMLFVGGFYLGRHGGRRPWLSGLLMLTLGAGLVLATIALGG